MHCSSTHDLSFKEKGYGDRHYALRAALEVFKTCPKLNELNEADLGLIVDIIGSTPNPKRVMVKLIIDLDSSIVLDILRNENRLNVIADIYKKEL